MKQTIIFLSLLLGLVACKNSSEEMEPEAKTVVNSLDNYKFWGEAHNQLLQIAVDTYGTDASRAIGDDDAKPSYEQLNQLQIRYAQTLAVDPETKQLICQGLEECKEYYDTEKFYNDYFKKEGRTLVIVKMLQDMREEGVIDTFEYNHLKILSEIVWQYHEGLVGLSYLGNYINEFKTDWQNYYGSMTVEAGQVSGYVLSIADSSVTWWNESEFNTRAVPAWVAADVGGAIVGATIQGIRQYLKNNRITSWKEVGISALTTAVTSSTGIAGKIGKWLFH